MIKFLTLILLLAGCSTSSQRAFKNKQVCFLLFNLNTGTFEKIINQKNCEERLPAASTFKVPLAVMAFDSGVLKDENSSLKWDGKKRFLESWNQDQTASSWMRESVVWFSQEIAPRIGKDKMQEYLDSFEYGNRDISGGLTTAWLTPATLKVSGFEQVHFLKKLWRENLKVSTDSQLKTKKILASEVSSEGHRLSGKTGSGRLGAKNELRVGWWIGFLETEKSNYVVLTNFVDEKKSSEETFGGYKAREMTKKLLSERKLW